MNDTTSLLHFHYHTFFYIIAMLPSMMRSFCCYFWTVFVRDMFLSDPNIPFIVCAVNMLPPIFVFVDKITLFLIEILVEAVSSMSNSFSSTFIRARSFKVLSSLAAASAIVYSTLAERVLRFSIYCSDS